MATRIPRSHPRHRSLTTREVLRAGLLRGWVHETGLIAHGRGEAFDYLLGERTTAQARRALSAAASFLVRAKRPVVCVNGNVVALAARDAARLANALDCPVEVNIFHADIARRRKLVAAMKRAGARRVLGLNPDARIPRLASDRAPAHRDGVWAADVVLVPLEDGDRAAALRDMGKTVIAIDLNPLSRTAKTAHVTIVDELTRCLPQLVSLVKARARRKRRPAASRFDNHANLAQTLSAIQRRLAALARTNQR